MYIKLCDEMCEWKIRRAKEFGCGCGDRLAMEQEGETAYREPKKAQYFSLNGIINNIIASHVHKRG